MNENARKQLEPVLAHRIGGGPGDMTFHEVDGGMVVTADGMYGRVVISIAPGGKYSCEEVLARTLGRVILPAKDVVKIPEEERQEVEQMGLRARMKLHEKERARMQAEFARDTFLLGIFALSPRVSSVILGSTVGEFDEDDDKLYTFKVRLDDGSIEYPDQMPEEGQDPEADRVLDAVDALNVTSTFAEFDPAFLVGDEEEFTRAELEAEAQRRASVA